MTTSDINWFRQCGWGVMVHYLAEPAGSCDKPDMSVEKWNSLINAFDVDGLARQLEKAGAGYLIITLGQNTGFYLAPNETYDRIVGRQPSRCSRRDLVADLSRALAARNIKLMAYLPSNAPIFDPLAVEKLEFAPAWPNRDPLWCGLKAGDIKPVEGVDSRLSRFQRHWEAVITEWSLRWGRKVAGWWIDGCYHADLMYDFQDEPNWQSFIRALKAGNQDGIVGFNPGGGHFPLHSATPLEDFTAGHDPGKCLNLCAGPKVSGVQWHSLCRLGTSWGGGELRFCNNMVKGYTSEVISRGGVITWDVPAGENGLLREEFAAQLECLVL